VEIRIVFDGPPGPESGSFVEVENEEGHSIHIGKWHERDNGQWELRIDHIQGTVECFTCGPSVEAIATCKKCAEQYAAPPEPSEHNGVPKVSTAFIIAGRGLVFSFEDFPDGAQDVGAGSEILIDYEGAVGKFKIGGIEVQSGNPNHVGLLVTAVDDAAKEIHQGIRDT